MENELIGKFTHIIFHNKENGFIVAKFKENTTKIVYTVTGYLLQIDIGLEYKLIGNLFFHSKYGEQFKFVEAEKILPTENDKIIDFLSSNEFKGIGKKTAQKIVEIFKENTIAILQKDPSILLQYEFKHKHVQSISDAFHSMQDVSKDIILLRQYGIHDKIIKLSKEKFGDGYLDILLNDIYYASRHISGLSCNMCDFYISQTQKECDLFSKECAVLFEKIKKHFFTSGSTYRIFDESSVDTDIKLCLNQLQKENLIVITDNKLYLKTLYDSEVFIAQFLMYFDNKMKCIDVSNDIKKQELILNIAYDQSQKQAIQMFFNQQFCIVSGGPGTGKTTITRTMIDIFKEKYPNKKIAICAPTGRAAKRISELVNVEATTIHRLLKWDLETDTFKMNEHNPLDIDLLVVDECSMIDSILFSSLLKANIHVQKILLIGDKDQLPSIASGNVLCDLLLVKSIPRVLLDQNHRQLGKNGIIKFAYDINYQLPILNYADVCFESLDIDKFLKKLSEIDNNDTQIISAMYKGVGGIDFLNQLMQNHLNPASENKEEIAIGNKIFRVNDKILQLKNQIDDNVYNGDIGKIIKINTFEKQITIDFDGILVEYDHTQFDSITHGYCISIHKSQGSEYSNVILFLPDIHQFMMDKSLVYTAVTRAKKQLIVFGDKHLIQNRIQLPPKNIRLTSLAEMIRKSEEYYETL